MKNLLMIILLLITADTFARAFKFDQTKFRGTGCKKGTTSTIVSPDGQTLSILFDDFSVEVPQYDGDNDNNSDRPGTNFDENLDHKKCFITINTDVPVGHTIESVTFDFDIRGSAYIEDNAFIRFMALLTEWKGNSKSFKDRRGGKLIAKQNWHALNMEEEWTISRQVEIPVRTGCQRNRNKVVFKMENRLMAFINKRRGGGDGFAFSTIDSQDMGGKLNFRVNTRPCNGSSGSKPAVKPVKKPKRPKLPWWRR